MIFEPKHFQEHLEFVRSKSSRANFNKFLFLLKLTRVPFLKRNSAFLSLLQYKLLENVAYLQNEATKLSKERKATSDTQEIDRIDRKIRARREILRVLLTIMDGVVARCFYFNRPFLRVMSENRSPGHITKESQDHLSLLQSFLLKFRNGITLINDITRYLRIGDITRVVGDRKILIYEAKTNVKTGETRLVDVNTIFEDIRRNKNFPNRQRARHLIAQMAIINKRISVPEDATSVDEKYRERLGVDIIELDIKIKNHFKKISRILNLNRSKMLASELLEPGYFVAAMRCDLFTKENVTDVLEKYKALAPAWAKRDSKYQFRVSNYQTFLQEDGEFARNTLPYSVFPFSAEKCLRLLNGDIYLAISLDLTHLKQKLVEAGWEVEDGDFFELQNYEYKKLAHDPTKPYAYKDPVVFRVLRETEYGGYSSTVLATQILLGMLSFYSLDYFVDTVNAQFAASTPGDDRFVTHHHLDEEKLFV